MTQFDDTSAVYATYVDKGEMSREDALKAQEQLSLADQSTVLGILLDGTY